MRTRDGSRVARTDDAQNIRTKAELYRLVGDIESEKKDL
jgi:hypothetical protein